MTHILMCHLELEWDVVSIKCLLFIPFDKTFAIRSLFSAQRIEREPLMAVFLAVLKLHHEYMCRRKNVS